MIPKPEIQYVGQFYVHGSEAKKLEPKKVRRAPKTRLPVERRKKREKIVLDPVSMGAIVVAVVMLVTMAVGALRLQADWAEYDAASKYLSYLNRENAQLEREYLSSFDLEEVRSKAIALGLKPKEDVTYKSVQLILPQPKQEEAPVNSLLKFWKGLWE